MLTHGYLLHRDLTDPAILLHDLSSLIYQHCICRQKTAAHLVWPSADDLRRCRIGWRSIVVTIAQSSELHGAGRRRRFFSVTVRRLSHRSCHLWSYYVRAPVHSSVCLSDVQFGVLCDLCRFHRLQQFPVTGYFRFSLR